ncbi:unnamed protein product [Lupinus luteus]|uniref:X8 domain-containing protein n=1 Tax=Lupinus luteus TaxID=3873 RepID=A0AAV1XA97_LUPLU
MDSGAHVLKINVAILYIVLLASIIFPHSDAVNRFNMYSNFDSYGSPSSIPLPPFNSLAPQPTPQTSTPSSLYPPSPSLTPIPTYSHVPNPPHNNFEPPPSSYINVIPPPHNNFEPPSSYVNVNPPPPYGNSSPPKHSLSPPKSYRPPPPSPPPPNHKRPQDAVWCVAKPTVPDPIVQVAMDYACGCGADCKLIQPNGSCYQPNTLLAHASYAFNSYWQKTKFSGGTCDFGGTAMLITVDPSYNKCNYTLA